MVSSYNNQELGHTKISVATIAEVVIMVVSVFMNLVSKLWIYDLMPSNYLEATGAIVGGITQSLVGWMLMPLYLVTVFPVIWIMNGFPDPNYPIYSMIGNLTYLVIVDMLLTVIWYCLIVKLYMTLKNRLIKRIA